jgi:hypothetical protein
MMLWIYDLWASSNPPTTLARSTLQSKRFQSPFRVRLVIYEGPSSDTKASKRKIVAGCRFDLSEPASLNRGHRLRFDCPSAPAVGAPPMVCAVDEDDAGRFVDLIDHAKLSPAGRIQPLEFALEWLACSVGILGDRAEDRLYDRGFDLVGQPVEMPEAFRRDLNLVDHL